MDKISLEQLEEMQKDLFKKQCDLDIQKAFVKHFIKKKKAEQLTIRDVSGSALTAVRMIRDAVEYGKLRAWNSEVGNKKAKEIMDEFHSGKYKRKDGMWVQVNWAVEKFEEHYR
tara:strand:+ start:63 stop:404 length:342 start_codon:yes stop_codon:yes gene_type:complete